MGEEIFINFDENMEGIEPESLINIDDITDESIKKSKSLLDNYKNILFDEEFLKNQPKIRQQIEQDLENIQMLTKMLISNDKIHDLLVTSIGKNPENASLYRGLFQLQSSILSIQKQMQDIFKRFESIKHNGIQMELEFKTDNDETGVYRGSREYIMEMQKQQDT